MYRTYRKSWWLARQYRSGSQNPRGELGNIIGGVAQKTGLGIGLNGRECIVYFDRVTKSLSPYWARSAFCVVMLLPSCSSSNQGQTLNKPTKTKDALVQNKLGELLSGDGDLDFFEIMRLVASIRPWPDSEELPYSEQDWVYIECVAKRLQQEDEDDLYIAFQMFVDHQETCFDPPADCTKEWSRLYLLMRVMFDVPSEEVARHLSKEPDSTSFAGFLCRPVERDSRLPNIKSLPIIWAANGPRMIARRGGYSGGKYNVQGEFDYFMNNYGLRKNIKCRMH